MKRVVVTGMGIWSCIGQDLQTVTESLKAGRSGIIFDPQRVESGLQSGLVGNVPRPDLKPLLPRKYRATMSEDAEYAYMAARQAFEQAGINDDYLRANDVGIIFGSDYITNGKVEGAKLMREEKNSLLLGPNSLFQSETSSVTMNLSGIFHIKGINLCVAAGCASASHSIGVAMTLIRQGMQDVILVGGANETSIYGEYLLDGVCGISVQNNTPQEASRPYDTQRDGHVPSGGGAALVLEEYEHAKQRGASIIAELVGYGFSTDGTFIMERDYKQVVSSISRALEDAQIDSSEVNYVNSFASGSIYDDTIDAKAMDELFVGQQAYVGSTESITGHEHNMTGASKVIYTILMMQNNFIAPTINLNNMMPEAKNLKIATKIVKQEINTCMIVTSGIGHTNCSLIIRKR